MLPGLDHCRRRIGETQGLKQRGPKILLLLVLVALLPLFLVLPSWAENYEEKDYSGSFSTDFFFPYLDYNEKDGLIPGLEWQASSFTGDHNLGFRGGIGIDSGKPQLLAGYTYLGWYPAIGLNLFNKNTFFEDISQSGDDEDNWRREVGGALTFSFPLDLHHRLVPGYEISWVDLPEESERLNGILLSFVRDTAKYYILEIISGSLVNLTGQYGNEALGSQREFYSLTGDVRFIGNLDLEDYLGSGERLVAALRVHGGYKEDDPRFFVLGGQSSLRGYDFNEFSGEKMWAASLELRYPAYVIRRTTTAWDFFHFHQLLALAFVDSGETGGNDDRLNQTSGVEVGVGGGLRLQMFVFGKIPFIVGFDLAQSVTDTERDPKAYLVLRLGF